MDVIQSTVNVFSAVLQRIRTIGSLLISTLPEVDEMKEKLRLFWIFNW